MRKIITGVVGSILIALGIVLLFIPGPGLLLILAGLALLSIDFPWARRMMERVKRWASGQRSSPEKTADTHPDARKQKK